MSPLRSEVRTGWLAFNAPLEGRVRTMYRDTAVGGYVTTGVGFLIDPYQLAQAMPWLHEDGTEASDEDVLAEFRRVRELPPAQEWHHYLATDGTGLHISDDTIDNECMRRLGANVALIVGTFPEFVTWPAEAQQAVCSIAWACGAGCWLHWPHLTAAALRWDWQACADACTIVRNPKRSAATRALFLAAAAL